MISHALFVGTIGEGIFHSGDSGQTFRRACDGMDFVECYVRALVVDPATNRLYAGNEAGVWGSDDAATDWRCLLPSDGASVWSLHVQGSRLVAGMCPSRLLVSDDGGQHWREAAAALERSCPRIRDTRVTCVTGHPDDPDRLWAGVEIDGVWTSGDGGRTWQPIGEGLSSRDIHALVVVPGAGPRLLATTNNDLNLSEDGGKTWRALGIDAVLPWKYTRSLMQKVNDPRVIFLGGGDRPPGWQGAIAVSRDGGLSWKRTLPSLANSTIWNFAVHPADAEMVYASSVSGQVYRSRDGGESWQKLATEFGEIRGLAWMPLA